MDVINRAPGEPSTATPIAARLAMLNFARVFGLLLCARDAVTLMPWLWVPLASFPIARSCKNTSPGSSSEEKSPSSWVATCRIPCQVRGSERREPGEAFRGWGCEPAPSHALVCWTQTPVENKPAVASGKSSRWSRLVCDRTQHAVATGYSAPDTLRCHAVP